MSQSQGHCDGARLASLLAAGGVRARTERRQVLVSLCERVPALDPLVALESLVRASASDGRLAAHVAAGRMFWTRARDGFTLVGLGAVATFAPAGPDRFASVDRAWHALLDRALIADAIDGTAGPGPVLMGGFAFESEGPRSQTWRGFPDAHLIVPRLQIASVGGACWLTISAIVGPDGEPDVTPEELTTLTRAVLAAPAPLSETTAPIDPRDAGFAFSSPLAASAWRALVGSAVAAIRAGALQKVVLAREVHAVAPRASDVFALLRHLRAAHRDCFVFGYWRGESAFVGASPERLVRLDGRDVRASSLAGSAKRGATPEEDAELAAALLASAKDQAEHVAVREALCDGLAELCDDVTAAEAPSLLTLRHVHHLHTAVAATLRRGHSLLDVVARLHPTPAVGGTPRDAALRFIRRHEQLDRGWYAAPIGWVGRRSGEFAVALRSAVISGSEAMLFAGCGIVADSDPELEFAESLLKLRPMQAALADTSSAVARATVGAELVL
jgi:isochorismate synthase